jgi:membrane-associated phospholipid phosphatase
MARVKTVIALLSFCLTLPVASVQAWPIDHRLNYDNSGFWAHSVQTDMITVLVVGEVATGFWVGGETRFGKTNWQAIDSTAAGAILAQTGKFIFTRSRPSQSDNPNLWFKGKGNYSFPSGEVTTMTSIVTPFILEYGHDYPAVYALTLLPVYTGVARMKEWGHWQTDVIASWALGAGTGYLAHSLETPFILSWLPHGVMVGWHTQF